MSKVQVDKVVNLSDDGAPQLTYGAELPVGYGLTGAGGLNITGVVTAASAVFSGNVTIGGTLTYEDVTNIDVVGVSTFAGRMNVNSSALFNEGLNVTAGVTTIAGTSTFAKATTVNATLTASEGINVSAGVGTFAGNVSIADKIIHTGDTNTAIRFPSADTISLETAGSERARVTSDGEFLVGTTTDNGFKFKVSDGGASEFAFAPNDSGVNSLVNYDRVGAAYTNFKITALQQTFFTGTSPSERARIDANGQFGLGTGSNIDERVHFEHDANITMLVETTATGSGANSALRLKSAESSSDWYVQTGHAASGGLRFYSGDEKLRIDSSGRLLIGTAANQHNSGDLLQLAATSSIASLGLNRYTANAHPSYINFFKSRSASLSGQTVVQDGDNLGQITWAGSDGTNRAYAAFIDAEVDGTPGDGDMPGRLTFSTSADGSESPSERLRIRSNGNIACGTAINVTNTYEFSVTAADGTGGFYAHGRNHYLNNTSDAYASLTIKKGNADSDSVDYLQLRDSGNNYLTGFNGSGNLKPASGKGIDFSSTGNGSGGQNIGETLDDYEKGDFNATCDNSVTLYESSDSCSYIKVGNLCHVQGQLRINSSNSGSVFVINNLPFTASNPTDSGGHTTGAVRLYNIDAPSGIGPFCIIYDGLTEIQFRMSRDNTTDTSLVATDGGYFAFGITYRTT